MRRLCLLIVVLLLGVFVTSAQEDDENTISYGETVTGEMTESDNVRYTFEGSAGDVVTITMIATDGNLDPRLYLTTPDDIDALSSIADNDDSGDPEIGERNSRIADFALPEAGTYLILASRFRGTGTFTLTLETPDNPADIDMEPGTTLEQWAVFATGTSQYDEDVQSFMQATGAPDTDACGDLPTAWASSERDSSSEIIALEYEQAVIPTQVNIHQTFNPGSIIRVELVNSDPENEVTFELPDSADPPGNTDCPGVFTLDIDLEDPQPVNGVIIYLDQSEIGNWNEIDAVELVGTVPGEAEPSPSALENTDLTEQFVYNDAFSMMLPSGWVTGDDEGVVVVASDQATFDLAISGDNVAPADGQIAISILLPETLQTVNLPTDQGPVTLLEAFNAAVEATSPVEDYDELLSPGAISIYEGDNVPAGTATIAYEYIDGSVLAVIQIGGAFADFEPLIIDILDQAFYAP